MRRTSLLISILWLGFLLPVMALAGSESLSPWGMASSVPRWAEAEAKSGLVRGPVSSLADFAHSYDVLFYQLNLHFPMTTRYLEGTVLIRGRSEEDNLTSIYLHLNNLTVDSILVDGNAPSSWNHVGGKVTIDFTTPFSKSDTFEVLVGYGGTPSRGYLCGGQWGV